MPLTILICLIFIFAETLALDYTDCGSTAKLSSLTLQGCTKQPCVLIKGQTYKLKAVGKAVTAAKSLPYTITATWAGLFTKTIVESDVCKSLEVGFCPYPAGTPFTYSYDLAISKDLPSVHAVATTLAKDEKGKNVLCVKINVQIKASRKEILPPPPIENESSENLSVISTFNEN